MRQLDSLRGAITSIQHPAPPGVLDPIARVLAELTRGSSDLLFGKDNGSSALGHVNAFNELSATRESVVIVFLSPPYPGCAPVPHTDSGGSGLANILRATAQGFAIRVDAVSGGSGWPSGLRATTRFHGQRERRVLS